MDRWKPLWHVLKLLLTASPRAMFRGALLSLVVLLMGVALLGLSGWFITATGIAGVAVGIAFDVFLPSAGVRMLALGRTAARYGERVLTHDATLRALAALRVRLLRRQGQGDGRALMQLRGQEVLTRIIADVDALDGLVLRLALPVGAGLLTLALAGLALWGLVGWQVALLLPLLLMPGAAWLMWRLARRGMAPSEASEAQLQAFRRGLIDLLRDRAAVISAGLLPDRRTALQQAEAEARDQARLLDGADRRAAMGLSLLHAGGIALALVVAGAMVSAGQVGAASAAIAVFVALSLGEVVLPLRRGFAEAGRMAAAARRIDPAPVPARNGAETGISGAPVLEIEAPDVTLKMQPGDVVSLTGPSGVGKTTLLMQIAGLAESGEDREIRLSGRPVSAFSEAGLRKTVSMVPQRSALLAGSVRDNLTLVKDADDTELWAVLETVELASEMRLRAGLDTELGEGGAGLSGGQARRLCLARALLQRPKLLLLDEPTEGLDTETAVSILSSITEFSPETAMLIALHRGAEHPVFSREITLRSVSDQAILTQIIVR